MENLLYQILFQQRGDMSGDDDLLGMEEGEGRPRPEDDEERRMKPTSDDYEKDKMEKMEGEEDEGESLMIIGLIILFGLPIANAYFYGNELFRFRSLTNYYKAGLLGTSDNTNWWELANTIYLWGNFIIWIL